MRFQVLVESRPRPVELVFGDARDLRSIGHWRAPAAIFGQAAVRDTVEFARLASKRYRHHLRSIPTAASITERPRFIRMSLLRQALKTTSLSEAKPWNAADRSSAKSSSASLIDGGQTGKLLVL
jgi:hypothetical protein